MSLPSPEPGVPFLGSATRVTRQQLRARRFLRLAHDLYVLRPVESSLALTCDAVLTAVPDAHLSHRTAGCLWGLPVDEVEPVHVTRPPGRPACRRSLVVTHRARLSEPDTDTCRDRPVTSLPRTFVDLAATSDLPSLVAVGDVVLRRTSRADIEAAVGRAGRRKGVVLARQALPLLHPGAASASESRLRLVLHGAAFTGLQPAMVVSDQAGQWVGEADLGDAEARVCVQYDGLVHFTGTDRQRISDVARDEQARLAGWEVVVLTAQDLRRPHLAIAKVAAAYERSAQRAAGRTLPPPLFPAGGAIRPDR